MNKVFSFFKGIRLNRILTIATVSLLMLFSTACSRATATDTSAMKNRGVSDPITPGQVQPYKGGMNNFEDADPNRRLDKGSVDAKAKALRDRVQRNIDEKSIDSPEQYVKNYRSGTPLNERIENIGEDVSKAADEAKDSLKEFSNRGPKNLERNAKDVPEKASRGLDQAKRNVEAAGKDISRGVKEPIDKAGKALNRAGEAAQDKAASSANAVSRSVD